MTERHHRRSIRLQGYDYSSAGAYFVTICAKKRECLFGEIVDGEMRMNDAGRIVNETWLALSDHYSGWETDAFVVMPNHVHGILVIVDGGAAPQGAAPQGAAPQGYDHVIRNENSLDRIRHYIAENPVRWAYDCENPDAASSEPNCNSR